MGIEPTASSTKATIPLPDAVNYVVYGRRWPVTAARFENSLAAAVLFFFPFAPSAAKGVLLLLRSWSPPQRAVKFVWVITCRVGVCFLVCLLAVGQKSVGTTMAAAMTAITLLPSPYATNRVVGFPLRVKE
ncbi:unnamed protein product [Lactuca saligna]|uniref:Uncharacterized protein n=1 Tax=Lactuca saligna TaxID=75948 RepID=A0AA35YEY8_LACSI|nr:unnamed protein product [Lactuca saligna]